MKANFEIHPIQAKALRVLLFQTRAKLSELNVDKISTDKFNFHLKALISAGILEKKANNYYLTNPGKEFANRFDTEKIIIERQAKLTMGIVPVKMVGKKKYYLIHQRLKQPYFGYHGTINGKIRWGEKVFEAAKRELFEETGLMATKMTFVGVSHKMDLQKDGNLIDDKYFYRVRVDKFSGVLKENVPEGKNFWLTQSEIKKLPNLFPDMLDLLKIYNQNKVVFVEKEYSAEGF
ncbi:NUDIX domain-containing protein [Candidatus Microgenomates bacterium]|nr:NUDIX domain-containing protein [Candidatus Microgenomates bacterium]